MAVERKAQPGDAREVLAADRKVSSCRDGHLSSRCSLHGCLGIGKATLGRTRVDSGSSHAGMWWAAWLIGR